MEQIFVQLSVLIILATGLALLLRALGQPLVLAYIFAGVAAGPLGLNVAGASELVTALSSFGIALLLFLVGLELNLERLRHLLRPAVLLGLGQIATTAACGYIVVRAFGISGLGAWYVALALTFSSTIIVVKLLADNQELDSLSGRLSVSVLLAQDALALLVLTVLPGVSLVAMNLQWLAVAVGFTKAVLLVGLVLLCGRYVLPRVFSGSARTPELLTLSAIAWCLLVTLAASWLGLSLAIGAFAAGVALADLPYNLALSARLSSLRDFFIVLFFISLGSQLTISSLGSLQSLFWALSLFVIIVNPAIVLGLMLWRGYRARTSLSVALTMGMISEFSLILVQLGSRLGHIPVELAQVVTAVGALTITVTTYLIAHTEQVYRVLRPYLKKFERSDGTLDAQTLELPPLAGHVVLFGHHRLGERIARTLHELGRQALVVDFNPDVITALTVRSVPCLYGDMGDAELLERAHIQNAAMVISTVPDVNDNLRLLQDLRQRGSAVPVYLTATSWHDCVELYQAGADYVIFPHYLSGEHFSLMLKELALNPDRVRVERERHFQELAERYAGHTRR